MPVKPSSNEEEYFKRLELERQTKMAEEKRIKMEAEEKKKRKDLHYMCCPKCGMNLIAMDYKGIEIDECSSCKGIWLDANELGDIIKMEKNTLNRLLKIFKS